MASVHYDKNGTLVKIIPGAQPRTGFPGTPPVIARALQKHQVLLTDKDSKVSRKLKAEDLCKVCQMPAPPEGARIGKIREVIAKMDARDASLWTGDGKPKTEVLEARLGWKPTAKERDDAWTEELKEAPGTEADTEGEQ